MTRLNTAPQTELNPDVYSNSLKPLEYLGIGNLPSYDDVATALEDTSIAEEPGRLVVVPPALEELSLNEWDVHLRAAFARNQAARGTDGYMPGLTIANLVIHETFRRHSPNLQPAEPTIATFVESGERQSSSFATYVLYQLGLALGKDSKLGEYPVKATLSNVEPTLYEAETYDPVRRERIVSTAYDAIAGDYRKVVPVVTTTNLVGRDALDAAEPRLGVARWGQSVEQRTRPYTVEGLFELLEWIGKFPATVIEEVRVNPGHRAITVLPRIVR